MKWQRSIKLAARCGEEGGKVRTSTQERAERMRTINGIGVDTRESKDKRETKDNLRKDCRNRER